jgi:hypothetical protein
MFIYILLTALILVAACGFYVANKNDYNFDFTPIKVNKDYSQEELDNYIDQNYVTNVPDKYKGIFGLVCSKFPELKNEKIVFTYERIQTTMQSNPIVKFPFKIEKYEVSINESKTFDGVKFEKTPLNAQIGILAHEFCHIIDYSQKNKCEILGLGVSYLWKSERIEYEREIDKLTILKGFGYQLKDWAQYAMYDSDAIESYKEFKRKNYLKPEEIENLILLKQNEN